MRHLKPNMTTKRAAWLRHLADAGRAEVTPATAIVAGHCFLLRWAEFQYHRADETRGTYDLIREYGDIYTARKDGWGRYTDHQQITDAGRAALAEYEESFND